MEVPAAVGAMKSYNFYLPFPTTYTPYSSLRFLGTCLPKTFQPWKYRGLGLTNNLLSLHPPKTFLPWSFAVPNTGGRT